MRISNSTIQLSSQHQEHSSQCVTLQGKTSFRSVFQGVRGQQAEDQETTDSKLAQMLQKMLQSLLAALEGKNCRSVLADEAAKDGQGCADASEATRQMPKEREMTWSWTMSEHVSEFERTAVQGEGVIKTTDGRTIDFAFDLNLCRSYECTRTTQEEGKMVLHDPLVLNFDGQSADLTGKRIQFDLDNDGLAESIPGLSSASGYLVLDRNANGQVDRGSELFGAKTGNGFGELAAYDTDHNGWIDEADPIYQDLRIWRGGAANDDLETLSKQGVGALYLGAVDSPFALKDSANQLLGEIRAAGFYLHEDGHSGSLQQVDLAVAQGSAA